MSRSTRVLPYSNLLPFRPTISPRAGAGEPDGSCGVLSSAVLRPTAHIAPRDMGPRKREMPGCILTQYMPKRGNWIRAKLCKQRISPPWGIRRATTGYATSNGRLFLILRGGLCAALGEFRRAYALIKYDILILCHEKDLLAQTFCSSYIPQKLPPHTRAGEEIHGKCCLTARRAYAVPLAPVGCTAAWTQSGKGGCVGRRILHFRPACGMISKRKIVLRHEGARNRERYRSGHNGADSKSV